MSAVTDPNELTELVFTKADKLFFKGSESWSRSGSDRQRKRKTERDVDRLMAHKRPNAKYCQHEEPKPLSPTLSDGATGEIITVITQNNDQPLHKERRLISKSALTNNMQSLDMVVLYLVMMFQ